MVVSSRYPDFLIVGAAKSGTTALWKYLGGHDEIFMTKEIAGKELGFFCNDYGLKDLKEYLSFFAGARPGQLIGESCHAYLSSPESSSLIKDHNPRSKIIVVLRNPVERAYSLYNWMVQNGYEYLSFGMSLKREGKILKSKHIMDKPYFHSYWRNYLYFESGLYYQQLKKFYDSFSAENILVILSDDLKKEPLTTTNKVLKFLGLREFVAGEISFRRENESKMIYSPFLNFIFYYIMRRCKGKQMLFTLARRISRLALKLNQSSKTPSKMRNSLRKELRERYSDDVHNLEKLLNQNLSKWLVD